MKVEMEVTWPSEEELPGVAEDASMEERLAATETILRDHRGVLLSDREVGRRCQLSGVEVGRIRRQLITQGAISSTTKRMCIRQGSVQLMDTVKIGPKRKRKRKKAAKSKIKVGDKTYTYQLCIGELVANQALDRLKSIHKQDSERAAGLGKICEWLKAQGICKCGKEHK